MTADSLDPNAAYAVWDRLAPDARGYFLGDYTGLTASGTTFDPFFMMSKLIASKGQSDPFANQAR